MVSENQMKIGDRVYLKDREEVTGVVRNYQLDNIWGMGFTKYYIKYDNDDIIPHSDWHDENQLVLIKGTEVEKECQCGVSSVMVNGRHSDYCKLYEES